MYISTCSGYGVSKWQERCEDLIMDDDILAGQRFERKGQKSMIVKIHNHKADSG